MKKFIIPSILNNRFHSIEYIKNNHIFKLKNNCNNKSIRYLSTNKQQLDVFDRDLKSRQRNWSFNIQDSDYYDYLRKECADRLIDRLEDIKRTFPLAIELGCHRGHIYDIINSRPSLTSAGGIGGIETLIQCDMSTSPVELGTKKIEYNPTCENYVKTHFHVCDEENIPFKEETFDLVLSSMNMHWINDLPSSLIQIKNILKPDGAFVGCMLGGNTLQELRYCFYIAEQERKGGLSPHTSPFALASDVAALMQGAGFSLPTVDVDTITIGYPNAIVLMEHLAAMGEGTASLNRQYSVGKDTMLSMAALYQELYGLEDGTVPATFQVIYMIGWSPDTSQPKPCKRGSQTKSLKDI